MDDVILAAKRGRDDGPDAGGKRQRSNAPQAVFGGAVNVLERVTDAHKLEQRQKQIDFGKNTLGYERYARDVRRTERKHSDPWTPDIREPDSKRQFDGKMKEWRRRLHRWEEDHPEPATTAAPAPVQPAAAATSSVASSSSAAAPEPTAAELEAKIALLEAEADALLAGADPPASGLTGGTTDLDAYLDGALDDDDDSDDDDDDDGGDGVATAAASAPPSQLESEAGSSKHAAPPVLTKSGSSTTSSALSSNTGSTTPLTAPQPRAAAAVGSIFGDASSIDDGLVG